MLCSPTELSAFFKKASELGMDGMILPDVPYEEKEEFDLYAKSTIWI